MLQSIFFNAVEVSFFMCPEWVIELFTQLISWKTQMIHEQNKSNLFYFIKICRSANPIPCPPIDTKVKEPRISMEMELLLLLLSGLSFFCILFWVTVCFLFFSVFNGGWQFE